MRSEKRARNLYRCKGPPQYHSCGTMSVPTVSVDVHLTDAHVSLQVLPKRQLVCYRDIAIRGCSNFTAFTAADCSRFCLCDSNWSLHSQIQVQASSQLQQGCSSLFLCCVAVCSYHTCVDASDRMHLAQCNRTKPYAKANLKPCAVIAGDSMDGVPPYITFLQAYCLPTVQARRCG